MPIVGQFGSLAGLGSLILPGGVMESIATVTLSTATADVSFSSIPQGYQHLQLRVLLRSSYAANDVNVAYYFNSDTTGTNYRWHKLAGDGASASASDYQGAKALLASPIPAANATSNTFGALIVDVLDYTSTSKTKTVRTFHGFDRNGAGVVGISSSLWNSTAAVTGITIQSWDPSWATNSTFALYGIKAP